MTLLLGNKYTAREDQMGNVLITRKADGAYCYLQGDDAIEFLDNHRILGAIEYPSGPFGTSAEHVDACLDQYDDVMSDSSDSSPLLDCLCGHIELHHQETQCIKCPCQQYRPNS